MDKSRIKILAIDDINDNLIALKALINELFPEALYIAAGCGKKGFELCQAERPDVILLDIVMPGMDGYEVCKKIKADVKLKNTPVVFVTANKTDKDGKLKALEAGADAFLTKPIDESELKAQVLAMLRIKESEDLKKEEKQRLEDLILDRTEALEQELADRKKAENKLIQSLEKITKNKQAILNLMEDLKEEMAVRKVVEENLKTERNLLRTLIDNLPDTIYVFDKECRKIIANKADVEVIGCESEADVLGKTDLEMYPDEKGKRFYSESMNVIRTGIPKIDYEEKFTDKNGKIRYLNTTQVPLYDLNGQVLGLVGIGHDITNRKSAELELIQARDKAEESDRLKTAFLHNISHEIRTPMNAIIGFSALLSEPGQDSESQKSFIDVITKSSNHLLSIVTDIIEISNIEAGLIKLSVKKTNLNEIMRNIFNEYSDKAIEKGIDLSLNIELADSEASIQTDEAKLFKVISSLVSNSLKFTASGNISFEYKLKNNLIEFSVSDTGIGIPQDHHSRIFDRFFQVENTLARQYEGTGLGLSISKAYVSLLGGEIWLDSKPGSGSVFYFTIPCIRDEKPTILGTVSPKNNNVKSKRNRNILIAEDEENNYLFLHAVLTRLDFNIIHAENGKEAVDLFESHEEIDLVLMDIKMPVMDGLEASSIIKKMRPSIPIIAQTAYAFESDKHKVLNAGCDDYLSKPIKKDTLIELINKYI